MYQMQPGNFQIFFRPKNKVFGPVQIPKKSFFFNLFLRFLWDFVPVLKVKKLYFSDFPIIKLNSEYMKKKSLIFQFWYCKNYDFVPLPLPSRYRYRPVTVFGQRYP
jgi:hypothetical protein